MPNTALRLPSLLLTAISFCLVLIGPVALAQEWRPGQPAPTTKRLNPQQLLALHKSSGESTITKFRAMDANRDGYLAPGEIQAEATQQYRSAKQAEMTTRASIGSELRLSEPQHIQGLLQVVMQADSNHDGRISEQEYLNWAGTRKK